ncbi:MAG: GumC family protein [Rhizobium sp.]
MSSYERAKAMSQLPSWHSNEPPAGEAEPFVRRPIVRPADYVEGSAAMPAEPLLAMEETVPPPPVFTPEPLLQDDVGPARPAASEPPPPIVVARPILDVRSAAQAIWAYRLLLLILAVIFAALGAAVMSLTPAKFSAETNLYFDPRQAAPSDSQGTIAPEAILTLIDSQTQILSSGKVLGRVVDALHLDQDPKFNGGTTGDAARYSATAALEKAVVIVRQPSTYVVSLKVTTGDPQLASRIANQIVTSFMEEETTAATSFYHSTNTALDGRLNDLRQQLRDAENAVETYRASNDMVTAQGNLIADTRLNALNQALVVAQQKTIDAKARAQAVGRLSFEDVVSTSGSDAVNSNAGSNSNSLSNLRNQYAVQAAVLGSLESQLGGRHPRLLAARSSLQTIANEIRSELQRLATSAQANYDQARKAEQDVGKELAVQTAQQVNTSTKTAGLNELQRQATAARELYEGLVKRSGQSNEDHSLMQNTIRVISEAEPPLKPDGQSRKVMMIAGGLAGLMLGLGLGSALAVLIGLFRPPTVRG